MPDFAYTARDATGAKVTGVVAAATEREAASQLTTQSLFPINLAEAQAQAGAMFSFHIGKRVSGRMVASFYSQLAELLTSGVPLLQSIRLLATQSVNPAMKLVLEDVQNRVEEGAALGEALLAQDGVFDEMSVSMIRAGGEGGFLEESLRRVATFLEDQMELRNKTLGALIYPLVLISIGTIVITGVLIFFVPVFDEIFAKMREQGKLPIATDILLNFSNFLASWWWLLIGGLALTYTVIRAQLHTESGRLFADRWKLKIPLWGRILQSLAVARFCRVLGTLLHNGVPILRSLEISRDATGNRVMSEAIAAASVNVSAGESLARPLAASKLFPAEVLAMISVAEESNSLETVLTNIANNLERRTAQRLDIMVRLLEPLLLLVLAGAVLFIALALMLPIMTMFNTIQ